MTTKKRLVFLLLGVLLLAIGLGLIAAGWAIGGPEGVSTEHYRSDTQTLPAARVHTLEIDAENAKIRLHAGAGPEVQIEYTQSEHRRVAIEAQDGTLRITERQTRRILGVVLNWSAHYVDVTLPASALETLSVRSINGSVEAEGLTVAGGVCLRTTNGGIAVTELTAGGDVALHTTNGGIAATDLRCKTLTAGTINGGITLKQAEVAAQLDCETTSGDVRLLACAADGPVRCETTHGDIAVELACGAEARRIEAETVNGRVRVPAGGDGEPVRLRSTNGDITLEFIDRE